jgi:acyl-coenzyme A thioesterase PaaI-like protein
MPAHAEPRVMRLYRLTQRLPLGRQLFTRAFQFAAPYFRSIPVQVVSVVPGSAVAVMRDRWRVHNHLGTVHAIALCNLAELTMGLVAEATIPASHRWIPKGMTVDYLAKARGLMTATASLNLPDALDAVVIPVGVDVTNPDGKTVFRAEIRIWVTPRPAGAE